MEKTVEEKNKELPVLIDINSPEIKSVLKILLKDRTTGKNIIWATDNYEELGPEFEKSKMMAVELLSKIDLRPRVQKSLEAQKSRTKSKAEVFTPSWICNQMNNHCDEIWFGRKEVFNIEKEKSWETKKEKIKFSKEATWYDYVQSRRLEITCGEAPYIVSRYDTSSGDIIPIEDRIGVLDRKIRVISENVEDEQRWFNYVVRAYKNTYAYEFQGDNLLLARLNLLLTFIEYVEHKWNRKPTQTELEMITNVIVKNVWQMDAFTECPPFLEKEEIYIDNNGDEQVKINKCKIYDWQGRRYMYFEDLKKEDKE